MPNEYRGWLEIPGDDFIEARKEGSDDKKVLDEIYAEVSAIVHQYGGDCDQWGVVEPDHIPFSFFKLPDMRPPNLEELKAAWSAADEKGRQGLMACITRASGGPLYERAPPRLDEAWIEANSAERQAFLGWIIAQA
jgi:hypothetical protein